MGVKRIMQDLPQSLSFVTSSDPHSRQFPRLVRLGANRQRASIMTFPA
jgi:hypothetical protein